MYGLEHSLVRSETFNHQARQDAARLHRTDEAQRIDGLLKLYCKPPDYLPSPMAQRLYGISPQTAFELGGEYDFTLRLLENFPARTTAAG